MKKLMAILLAMSVLLPSVQVMAAEKEAEKESIPSGWTVLAESDFDDSSPNLAFENNGVDMSIVELDKEHGKSMRLAQVSGHKRIGKYCQGGLGEGRFCFSFSVYTENVENLKIVRFYNQNAKTVMNSNDSVMSFVMSGGAFSMRRTDDWKPDYRLTIPYETHKWYDIEFWIDTVNDDFVTKINGEVFNHMKWQYNIENLTGVAFMEEQQVQTDKATYIDNLRFIKEDNTVSAGMDPIYVRADVGEDVVGNNFYNHLMPKFTMHYVNRLNSTDTYSVTYKAVDSDGITFWTYNDEITFGGEETLQKVVTIPEKHYGVHKFIVEMQSGDKTVYREIPYTLSNNSIHNPKNSAALSHSHLSRGRGTIEQLAPLLANAGFGGIRGEDFFWPSFELSRGQYKLDEHSQKVLEYLKEYDLKYISIYGQSPLLYQPEGTALPVATPEGYKGLENAYEWLANTMGDRLIGVEIWNEYHNSGFSGKYASDANVFANLHKAVYAGIEKSNNPDVLTLAFDEDPWGYHETQMVNKTLEALGTETAFSGISLHPYALEGDPVENHERLDSFVGGTLEGTKAKGYSEDIPMYFTEFGWSDAIMNMDAEKRAAWVIRAWAYFFAKYPNLKGISNYTVFNYPENQVNASLSEATFGMVDSYDASGGEIPALGKPLYVALAYWNNLQAEGKFEKYIEGFDQKTEVGYNFKDRNGDDYLLLATLEDDKNVGIYLGTDSAVISDAYGNEEKVYGIDGVFSFTLKKDRIMYIRGNFENPKKVSCKINFDKTSVAMPKSGNITLNVSAPTNFDGEVKCEKFDVLANARDTVIKDGKATVVFNGLEETKSGKVNVSVMNGDKVYYETYIDIEYMPSGRISDLRLDNPTGDPALWDVVFDVENIRTDKAISGTALSSDGEKIVKIPEIACGETREVRIPYKKINTMNDLADFSAELQFTTGDSVLISKKFNATACEPADTMPIIDGKFSPGEWKESPAMVLLNDPLGVRNIQKYGGEQDLSAKVYTKYDNENFYLGVDVTDNVFYQPNNYDRLWAGDSVQFSLAFDGSATNTTQYAVGLAADGKTYMYRYYQEGNAGGFAGEAATGLFEQAECAVTTNGGHTYYEVKLPWDKIKVGGGSVYQGKMMYFAVIANDDDNDGLGRGWIQICNAIGAGANTPAESCEMFLLKD